MSKYSLDVLLPFHRVDDYLFDAIESSKVALPPDSRIILINTSVEDFLIGNCLSQWDEKVKLVHLPGGNYIQALSFGLKSSEAKYVALMNSDDLVEPSRFLKQIQSLELNESKICVTRLQKFVMSAYGKTTNIPSVLGSAPNFFHEAILLLGSYFADASWCFDAEWAKENNLFSESNDISDWCTAMRVLKRSSTSVLNERLYLYRMHSGQYTRSQTSHSNINFYSSWNQLNCTFGFRALSRNEIDIVTANPHARKVDDLENVLSWLDELENFLILTFSNSSDRSIKKLFSKRRILVCFRNRSLLVRIRDVRVIPEVIFEYLRYRKHLRFKLTFSQ
jgi:hypothetical protein